MDIVIEEVGKKRNILCYLSLQHYQPMVYQYITLKCHTTQNRIQESYVFADVFIE